MQIECVKYMLFAQDMTRAVAFYRDVLGLTPTVESEHWSELKHGDAIVALHGGGDGSRNKTGLSFQVRDAEAACREAAQGGATVERQPESRPGEPIKLADLVDPEGNTFMITEYVG